MRERIIRIGVLSVVFVLALHISSVFLNRGNEGTTADMAMATLPTISFVTEGKKVNLLAGHINEMNIPAMRDTITPLDKDGKVQGIVNVYEKEIDSLDYEVYSLDGEEKFLKKSGVPVEKSTEFSIGKALQEEQEGVLKITLHLENEQEIYYYTRVVSSKKLHIKECIDYAKMLHTNMLEGTNDDVVKKAMEANASGDNTTLQHVDIHSDLEHSMWGDLSPKLVSEVQYKILETKSAYTSILLSYQVKCVGDNNDEEFYDVEEFFRIRYADEEYYLFDYERQLQEIFDGSKVVLMSKGINLGMTTSDTQYKVNQEGSVVAFVQNKELWCYDKEEDEFSLVFSFAESESEDIRNRFQNHSVKILSMEDNGNITFGVYGYMNRGPHEGESGVTIYYFNLSQNFVEEKAFVPSNQSQQRIEDELGELAYYNHEANVLYLLAEGTLYKIYLKTGQQEILLENLKEGQYVSSGDGHQIAYCKDETGTQVEVLNFLKESTKSIYVQEGEIIHPLGFVFEDFVYGVSRRSDVGKNSSGEEISVMYKVEIRDGANEVVKVYQMDGTYILGATVEGNMIALERASKEGDVYSKISKDYITNNEGNAGRVTLQSYWTNLKETQFRLVFDEGIKNKKANVLKPKQVLSEKGTKLALEHTSDEKMYAVYGIGKLVGLYSDAGSAIQKAKEVSGLVLSPKQKYVWEDGNRVAWYRNFEMRSFVSQEGETALEASVRAILSYQGKNVDVKKQMQSKSAFQVFAENIDGEAIQFKECSVQDMRYLIEKGTPVIAMTGGKDAIVLVGYDAKTVTYIEPHSGAILIKDFAIVDEMMKASGHTFFGYVN